MLALIIPARVFSPQYLIWLIPFLAVLGETAFLVRWLFLAACVATTVLFPFAYSELGHFHWWAIGVLNLRNALLLGCFLLLVGEHRSRNVSGEGAGLMPGRVTGEPAGPAL
jgi:hypothetical protein